MINFLKFNYNLNDVAPIISEEKKTLIVNNYRAILSNITF